jgi:hypothetical protein
MQQDSEALSLEQVLGVLRRRVPWIVLCVVVVAGAAYGYSKHEAKKYTATASLSFSNNSLSQLVAGLPATSSSSTAVAQQASNVELVTTTCWMLWTPSIGAAGADGTATRPPLATARNTAIALLKAPPPKITVCAKPTQHALTLSSCAHA